MGLDSKIPCRGSSTINGFLADPSIVTASSFKGMVEGIAFPAVEPLMMISFEITVENLFFNVNLIAFFTSSINGAAWTTTF